MLALVCLLLRQPLEVGGWLYFTPVPGYRQLASWTQATCLSLTLPRHQVGWRRGGAPLGSRPHAPGPLLSPHSRATQAKAPTHHAAGSGTSVHLRGAAPLGCSLFSYLGAGAALSARGSLSLAPSGWFLVHSKPLETRVPPPSRLSPWPLPSSPSL